MSITMSSLLVVTSVVILECTYGVFSQQIPEVDFSPASWRADRRPQYNEELLRNLADYLAYARNFPGTLRVEDNALPVVPEDGLAPLKMHKRACFNVLDACCMFNIKCDRFSKKRMSASNLEKKDSESVEPATDAVLPLRPGKRACFNVLDACCMFNIRCDRMGKKSSGPQLH